MADEQVTKIVTSDETEGLDMPKRDLSGQKISQDILKYVPQESAETYQFVPIGISRGILEIGVVDENNVSAKEAVSFIADRLGMPYKFYKISEEDFKNVIQTYEGLSGEVTEALGEFKAGLQSQEKASQELARDLADGEVQLVEDAPITKIVAVIIRHATDGNASDIHIEPLEDKLRVRFRVDGALYTSLFLPLTAHDAIIARIKIISKLKLDEKRKPQDGRFSAPIDGRRVDFRVSIMPSYYGEKVVIRILDSKKGIKTLEQLGLRDEHKKMIDKAIKAPYGLILITGPTGSGKTTTLYSMLNALDREKRNVVSLEDPVEYSVSGVTQTQVRPEIKFTFANGLRSILRQDPDVVMVGEIRDKETARLAVQASLTGHLVLSTLHTNNAIGVIPRLIDMGVDPFLIGPTLSLAIAQRLVRLICPESKDPFKIEGGTREMIDQEMSDLPDEFKSKLKIPEEAYHAKPSATCPGGTRGRQAVFEMFEMDRDLERIILDTPSEGEIYEYVRSKGMLSMREDAMIKAFEGQIPFEEVNTV